MYVIINYVLYCLLTTFVVTKQELEVNKMVAEFMIFANQSVAEKVDFILK